MSREAVIIGSGAAGSVVAWEFVRHGWSVTMLERGREQQAGIGHRPSGKLGTRYSSDEIKSARALGFPDGLLEPYTYRTQPQAQQGVAHSAVGALGQLGSAVGGTSVHFNAKFPRIFKRCFKMLSEMGPISGAQVADWPIDYDELAPYYDFVESRVGVQGDWDAMPTLTRTQAPRTRQFAMPPNPITYVATLLAEAAKESGYTAYPQPAAVNSRTFDGRPKCVSCGLCSGFGCPIGARGDATTTWLNPAMHTGRINLIARAFVHRIETSRDGRRATLVHYIDEQGERRKVGGDIVVVAGSPINTARLLLMSASSAHPDGLGNASGQVGRNMMFHDYTLAAAVMPEDVHPNTGQSNSMQLDDLIGPFTGPEITALGVPYINGGLVQVGGGVSLMTEAAELAGYIGYGLVHKEAMKVGLLHARVAGSQMLSQDLPQANNRVDLDPTVKDFHGFPAARVTYSPHLHEKVAAMVLGPKMETWHAKVKGSIGAGIIPYPLISTSMPATWHLAGTARMGDDPRTSVCGRDGRMHQVSNLYVADASLFPTFPGFNPTNTIMSNALRIACGITGAKISGHHSRKERV